MSRIHAAVRRASALSSTESAPPTAQDANTVAGEVATMVLPWENGPELSLVDATRDFARDNPEASDGQPGDRAPEQTPREGERPAAVPRFARTLQPGQTTADVIASIAPDIGEKLVGASTIKLFCVEQYRKLAASLHHAQAERGLKVVLVASALPGEGKTLTAVNLALTFSESYRRRVLLIDADLRHPAVHTVFQVPNTEGLNEMLKAEEERVVPIVRMTRELSLMPAGAADSDPMRALTSPRMKRVVQFAAQKFDWVIIDTPPVALLPDAKLLAAMADAVLMVVRAGSTPYRPIHRALESIGRERVIGVVLNSVDKDVVTDAKFGNYYDEGRA